MSMQFGDVHTEMNTDIATISSETFPCEASPPLALWFFNVKTMAAPAKHVATVQNMHHEDECAPFRGCVGFFHDHCSRSCGKKIT
jgi:hypothetical protein